MTRPHDSFSDDCPHLIAGVWTPGTGEPFTSTNPATGRPVWQGTTADSATVDAAVTAARTAQSAWADRPVSERIDILQACAAALTDHPEAVHAAIVAETGKPHWEVATEVAGMAAKVATTIEAWRQRQ